jgi:hypothetical protein
VNIIDRLWQIVRGLQRTLVVVLVVLFVVGGICFYLASATIISNDSVKRLFEGLGSTCLTVFAMTVVYEYLLRNSAAASVWPQIEHKLTEMQRELENAIGGMPCLLTKECLRLGVAEVFENVQSYMTKHPLITSVGEVMPGGRIRVVGRALVNLLAEHDAILEGIRNGIVFEFAMLDQQAWDEGMRHLVFLPAADLQAAWARLDDLATAIEQKFPSTATPPPGSLEMRCHRRFLPDTVKVLEQQGVTLVEWEVPYGYANKTVVVLKSEAVNLGANLERRVERLWNDSEPAFIWKNGTATWPKRTRTADDGSDEDTPEGKA